MKPYKWDQRVRAERAHNKEAKLPDTLMLPKKKAVVAHLMVIDAIGNVVSITTSEGAAYVFPVGPSPTPSPISLKLAAADIDKVLAAELEAAIKAYDSGSGYTVSTLPMFSDVSGTRTWNALTKLVPALTEAINVGCPALCMTVGFSVGAMVTHLNDKHRWPREKIADWLDSLDLDLTIEGVYA